MQEPRQIKQVAAAKTVAANLAAARKATGETQEEVAAAIGATQDQISRWERGDVTPGLGWQAILAGHFFHGDLGALHQREDVAA